MGEQIRADPDSRWIPYGTTVPRVRYIRFLVHRFKTRDIFWSVICRLIYCSLCVFSFLSTSKKGKNYSNMCHQCYLPNFFFLLFRAFKLLANSQKSKGLAGSDNSFREMALAFLGRWRNLTECLETKSLGKAVFWIRTRRARTFFDLPDPDPSLFVPIRIFPSSSKNILWLRYDFFLSLKNNVNVSSKSKRPKKWLDQYWRKEQDPDPYPDP